VEADLEAVWMCRGAQGVGGGDQGRASHVQGALGVLESARTLLGAQEQQRARCWAARAPGLWAAQAEGLWAAQAEGLWAARASGLWAARASGLWAARAEGLWAAQTEGLWAAVLYHSFLGWWTQHRPWGEQHYSLTAFLRINASSENSVDEVQC